MVMTPAKPAAPVEISNKHGSPLLLCGVALAPLFYIVVTAQLLNRAGFDIRIYPLSLLSLGDLGWIQITNFITTGILAIACAIGMRRALRETLGETVIPLTVSLFGVGMLLAGVFPPDPLPGFPPGTPAIVATMSQHAQVHGIGFALAFTSLTVACFVFARREFQIGSGTWGSYCAATGIATPILVALGMLVPRMTGVAFFIVGMVAFGWLSATAARLYFAKANSRTLPGV